MRVINARYSAVTLQMRRGFTSSHGKKGLSVLPIGTAFCYLQIEADTLAIN